MCLSIPSTHSRNIQDKQHENQLTLNDCINEMFKVECIDYKCSTCGNTENNRCEKKLLTKPKTLIIKLKRYIQNGNVLGKINKFIKYPETLDLSLKYCGSDIEKYHLYSVINHNGTLNNGHYYSYIKNNIKDYSKNLNQQEFEDNWFLCNDSVVNEMSYNNVLNSNNAYVLFYHSNN